MLSMSDTSASNPGCARTCQAVIVSLQLAGNVRLATWFLQAASMRGPLHFLENSWWYLTRWREVSFPTSGIYRRRTSSQRDIGRLSSCLRLRLLDVVSRGWRGRCDQCLNYTSQPHRHEHAGQPCAERARGRLERWATAPFTPSHAQRI